ncbi:DUF397 domain-containing protein [Actinomadura adrarensis]|uniref:DUF397 domain-containing protein n=1 Tax=Actinomadura adrarensis TaxID=1819600 RepID=A0ABW3C9V9_9ACTN
MENLKWRKSSHSGNGGMDCVEVARIPGSRFILARDSKQPDGPRQRYELTEMSTLIASIKAGRYDM